MLLLAAVAALLPGCGNIRVADSTLAALPAEARTSLPSVSIDYDRFTDRSPEHVELVRGREGFWRGGIRRGFEERARALGLAANPEPGIPVAVEITDVQLDKPGAPGQRRRGRISATVRVQGRGEFRIEGEFDLFGEGAGFEAFSRAVGRRTAEVIAAGRGR
jgi:hypothetical protein